MRKHRGFTLIELVMVMVIICVLSTTGAFLMVFLVENAVFVPNKLNVEMAGRDILETIIEGVSAAKGLRFTYNMTAANSTNVKFVNSDGQVVEFMFNNSTKRMTLAINNGTQSTFPAYFSSGMYVEQNGAIPVFSYYDASETSTLIPGAVRRVKVEMRLRSGSGSFSDWQNQLNCASSIAVSKYQ